MGRGGATGPSPKPLAGPGYRPLGGGGGGVGAPSLGRPAPLARGLPLLGEATPPAPSGAWSGVGRAAQLGAKAWPRGSLGAGGWGRGVVQGEPWGGRVGGGWNAAGGGNMATGAGVCRPICDCSGGGCTFAFFLGGWPCSGGGEKRVPSARCDHRRGHVPCRRHHRHQGASLVPRKRPPHCLEAGVILVAALEAEQRASLTAEVFMVSGLRPETSMVSWREAGEPTRVSGGGRGRRGSVCYLPRGRRD